MLSVKSAKKHPLTNDNFIKLYDIVINAYAVTEVEMFGPDYKRITAKEYQSFINKNQVLVAYLNNELAGGVRHYFVENGIYSFGLLSTDFNYLKKGIGTALINEVEQIALDKGAHSIRIEILRPENIELENKKMIGEWYQRIGYQYSHSIPFKDQVPDRAELTITPCIFDYYLKEI